MARRRSSQDPPLFLPEPLPEPSEQTPRPTPIPALLFDLDNVDAAPELTDQPAVVAARPQPRLPARPAMTSAQLAAAFDRLRELEERGRMHSVHYHHLLTEFLWALDAQNWDELDEIGLS